MKVRGWAAIRGPSAPASTLEGVGHGARRAVVASAASDGVTGAVDPAHRPIEVTDEG